MPTSTERAPAEALLDAPLLSDIAEDQKRTILRALLRRPVRKGEALIAQGVRNDRLWFLASGEVHVERSDPDGRAARLATLNGPAIYGTTTFFRPASPTATIRAAADFEAWTLDQAGLASIREHDPAAAEGLALSVVRVISEHFDLLDRKLADLLRADHLVEHPRASEWAGFRARLFEEPAL